MAAGKGPYPRPWPLGPQTAQGGPPPVPAPAPLLRGSAASQNLWPLASSAAVCLQGLLGSGVTRGGGCPEGGPAPAPTAGPGAGGAARPGHSSPSSQSVGARTLRRPHPRACCSRGDCGSDEGQGAAPASRCWLPGAGHFSPAWGSAFPMPSVVNTALQPLQRLVHTVEAL